MTERIILLPERRTLASFSKEVSEIILLRDNYTCQGIDRAYPACVWEIILGIPANRDEGLYTETSHWTHKKDSRYNSPERGRCQCLACHYLYSRKLGRYDDARLINEGPNRYTEVFMYDFINHPDDYPGLKPYRWVRNAVDVLKLASHVLRQKGLTYQEAKPGPIALDLSVLASCFPPRVAKLAELIPIPVGFDPVEHYQVY